VDRANKLIFLNHNKITIISNLSFKYSIWLQNKQCVHRSLLILIGKEQKVRNFILTI